MVLFMGAGGRECVKSLYISSANVIDRNMIQVGKTANYFNRYFSLIIFVTIINNSTYAQKIRDILLSVVVFFS